jgi:hypothetical protein
VIIDGAAEFYDRAEHVSRRNFNIVEMFKSMPFRMDCKVNEKVLGVDCRGM